MTNRMMRTGVLAILVLTGALAACNTGQPGVKNTFGTIGANLPAEPPEIANAAARVLEELDLTIITNNSSAIDGLVIARSARDEKIQVEIKDNGDVSKVSVRVGTWGDGAMGQTILNKIRAKLNLAAE